MAVPNYVLFTFAPSARALRLFFILLPLAVLPLAACNEGGPEDPDFSRPITTGEPERVGEHIYQFHFIHGLWRGGILYTYFIDHSQGSMNDVGLALSWDGVQFAYYGKVLHKGRQWYDNAQASFPDVQYVNGVWYMLYEAKEAKDDINSVCLAISLDGFSWFKRGPVIRPANDEAAAAMPHTPAAGPLGNLDVGTPTFYHDGTTWHVYFHMTERPTWKVRIGYATGADLLDLDVHPEPVIDVEAAEGIGEGVAGARSSVIIANGWLYLAYEVASWPRFTYNLEEANWGISLARAKEPAGPWEKWKGNPLIVNPQPGFGYDGPELIIVDDELTLYYRNIDNGTDRVRVFGLVE